MLAVSALERCSLITLVCALAASACKSDPPPDQDAGRSVGDAGPSGGSDLPVAAGDCLTGAAADLVRAIHGKAWLISGYVGKTGQITSIDALCMKASQPSFHYYYYYAFLHPGQPVDGTVDPACAIVRDGGLFGVDGSFGFNSQCVLDGTGSVCHPYFWQLSKREAAADGSMVFERYSAHDDGSKDNTYPHNGDQLRLVDGKLYELYNVGEYVWRIFEPSSAPLCPMGVLSPQPPA